jgi:hypothetical protein
MSASVAAAEKVLGELNEVGEVRKGRVQQAGFVVLKAPDIPSQLTSRGATASASARVFGFRERLNGWRAISTAGHRMSKTWWLPVQIGN